MPSVHASAVLLGARAVLIRGRSGAGKSRLALALIAAAEAGTVPFARLVADDRCWLAPAHGRLLVRPATELAGLIEVRGLGIQRVPFEPVAVVGLVVDLAAADSERLPAETSQRALLEGVAVARLAVASDVDPLPLVLALRMGNDAAAPAEVRFGR